MGDFRESIEVKTFVDGEIHRYFTDISIDKAIDDCMGTATLKCPYDEQLMSYWQPIVHSVGIRGGVYDNEWFFIGRTRGIKQDGYEIEIALQDEGWKFKQDVPDDLYKAWCEGGKTCAEIFSEICEIQGVFNFSMGALLGELKFDKDGNVVKGDEKIEQIPDPFSLIKAKTNTEVVSPGELSNTNYNKYVNLVYGRYDDYKERYDNHFQEYANNIKKSTIITQTEAEKKKAEQAALLAKATATKSATAAESANATTFANNLSKKLKKSNGYSWVRGCSSASCISNKKKGDCWAMSEYLYNQLTAQGITTKIAQYATGSSSNHRSVLYKTKPGGSWIDFPYRVGPMDNLWNNTAKSKSAKTFKCSLGTGKC